jgi:hypothetical protein
MRGNNRVTTSGNYSNPQEDPAIKHFQRWLSLSSKDKELEYPRFKEAAEKFGWLSEKTLEKWCNRYSVPFFWVGGVRRVHFQSLTEAIIKENLGKL